VELAGTGFEIRTVLRSARVSKYTSLLLLLLLFGVPSRVDDDDDDDAVVIVPDFDEVVVVFFLFFVFFFFFFFVSSSSSSSLEATLVFGTTTGRVRVATKSVEKTVMMTRVVVVAKSRARVSVSVVFPFFFTLVFFFGQRKKTDFFRNFGQLNSNSNVTTNLLYFSSHLFIKPNTTRAAR
jgi:hypothetical protein